MSVLYTYSNPCTQIFFQNVHPVKLHLQETSKKLTSELSRMFVIKLTSIKQNICEVPHDYLCNAGILHILISKNNMQIPQKMQGKGFCSKLLLRFVANDSLSMHTSDAHATLNIIVLIKTQKY